jgi:hypothetical protein
MNQTVKARVSESVTVAQKIKSIQVPSQITQLGKLNHGGSKLKLPVKHERLGLADDRRVGRSRRQPRRSAWWLLSPVRRASGRPTPARAPAGSRVVNRARSDYKSLNPCAYIDQPPRAVSIIMPVPWRPPGPCWPVELGTTIMITPRRRASATSSGSAVRQRVDGARARGHRLSEIELLLRRPPAAAAAARESGSESESDRAAAWRPSGDTAGDWR